MSPRSVPLRRLPSLAVHLLPLALLSLTGCKGGGVEKHVTMGESMQVMGVAVYPFGFRWDEPGWRRFALSQHLLDVASRELPAGLFWFGPSELRIAREDEGSFAGSDLVTLLPRYRVPGDQVVILRPWAERRVARSQKAMENARGQSRDLEAGEEITYVGHLEVVHPASRTVVAELRGEVTVDPLAEVDPEIDPSPALTTLMDRLVREATDVLDDVARERAALPPLPVELQLIPLHGLGFPRASAQASEGAATEAAATADLESALARTLAVSRLVRFFHPTLAEDEADALARRPAGLLVVADAPAVGLRKGDVITEVAQRPALQQTLQRERLLGDPVLLKVHRMGGAVEELSLPAVGP